MHYIEHVLIFAIASAICTVCIRRSDKNQKLSQSAEISTLLIHTANFLEIAKALRCRDVQRVNAEIESALDSCVENLHQIRLRGILDVVPCGSDAVKKLFESIKEFRLADAPGNELTLSKNAFLARQRTNRILGM